MTSFHLRGGTTDDADAIFRVHRSSILTLGRTAYRPEECESWAVGLSPKKYIDAMTVGGETYFVIEMQGEVVGFCSFKGDEVIGLYVDPSSSRRGVGSLLLSAVEKEIFTARISTIRLNAALSALKFYQEQGFSEVGRKQWKTRGGVEIVVCAMEAPEH